MEKLIEEIAAGLTIFQLETESTVNDRQSMQATLTDKINYLITYDFHRLVSILYLLDIPEKKLKEILSHSATTPAAEIISEMIIERQIQKVVSRKNFSNIKDEIAEDEKW